MAAARRIAYRVRQFVQALLAPLRRVDRAIVGRVLPSAQAALFLRQSRADQQHALAVYRALQSAGQSDPDLLAAALLHDVGKSAASLPAWARAAVVLLERFAPARLHSLARDREDGRGWRCRLGVYLRHAQAGADWVQAAGGSPRLVALIRHHDAPGAGDGTLEHDLSALRSADDAS